MTRPFAWWRLGDPSGTTRVVEAVTGLYPLQAIGDPNFGAAGLIGGDPNGAVSFTSAPADTGVTYSGLQGVFPEGTFPFTTEGTIEFLYRADAVGQNAPVVGLYALGVDGASSHGIDPIIGSGSVVFNLFNVAHSPPYFDVSTTGVTVTDQATHHIVLVWKAGETIRIYVDGVDRTGTTTTFTGTMADTTRKWMVAVNAIDYPPFVNVRDGSVATFDELVLYTTALTAAEIAEHYDAIVNAWAGDSSGERVDKILDVMPWPEADRFLDDGVSVLGPATIGGTVLSALQKVEETEQGALFTSKDGTVRFLGRDTIVAGQSHAVFGDSDSELEYADLSYVYDDQLIFNDVQVSREGGITQVVGDPASQSRYLRRTKVFDGMLYSTDTEARGLAEWWIGHYRQPLLRATGLHLEPSAGNATTHFPHVLGRELMDRVTVRRRPQNLGGAIDQEALIEGISHDVTGGEWITRWNLSPAEAQTYWLAGVAGRSEAGVSTVAAF